MISISILEIKPFMAKLLTNSIFDHFYLKEMELQTFTNFQISGQFNAEFYTKDELEERGEDNHFTRWGDVRGSAYAIIKGNKTPLALKIVFQLPSEETHQLLHRSSDKININEVGGLYLNIRFEKGELHIITGSAIKVFTLDKTLEQEWDRYVKDFLKEQGILFE